MCRVGDPANRHAVWRRPEVLVPARRGDTGPVAAAIGEARVCPWYPGRLDFNALEPAQQCRVGFRVTRIRKCRSMPGATDDGNTLEAFRLCQQGKWIVSRVRWLLRFCRSPWRLCAGLRTSSSPGGSHYTIGAFVKRCFLLLWCLFSFACVIARLFLRQLKGLWQIHETRRDAALEGVAQCLPRR